METYDEIMINRLRDIPMDYFGQMAVPTSFINHYNSEQFEIIGLDQINGFKPTYVNGKKKYRRIIIKRRGNNENRT